MKILVLNCGSSSIKYQLFEMPGEQVLAKGLIQRIGELRGEAFQRAGRHEIALEERIPDHACGFGLMERMLTDGKGGPIASLSEIGACGHRVVHGGEAFTGSVRVNERLEETMAEYSELAPLHNPPNLAGIREAEKALGDVPQVACFDTAFHQTLPEVAYLYALPYEMYERHRIRRYGFHGTSHRYVARRAAVLLGRGKYEVNLITCHLGNGCSVAAVREGRSVDTSMGLTPLEGLVMGTRTGDLDPAVVLRLMRVGYGRDELDRLFNRESGLLGVSGLSNDVRELERHVDEGDRRAKLALDLFAYKVKKYIGAYLAVLNGCDGVILTGGIGENGARMRRRILGEMDALGIRIDDRSNEETVGREGEIQAEDSRIRVCVIPTNEEAAIAHDTYALASGQAT
jgi:acetate kinase